MPTRSPTIDHRDLVASVGGLGRQFVDYILCTNDFEGHWRSLPVLFALLRQLMSR